MSLLERFDTPVQHELIDTLHQHSPFLLFGVVLAATVVTAFFWDRAAHATLLAWLGANLLLVLGRAVVVREYRRRRPRGRAVVRWGVLFALASTVSGMIWGSIPVLLHPAAGPDLFVVAIVLTGMVAGSLVPLSSFLPAYFGYALFALGPLAFVLLRAPAAGAVFVGYLVLVFLAVNLGYAFVVQRTLAESIRLRFENLDLLRDLERQRAIAERASADKSRFLAASSHDLRQPLHAMDLYLGALAGLLDRDEQRALLDKVRRASGVLSGLLASLMDVSRLDAGDVRVERRPTDIAALLEAIAAEHRAQALEAGITITVESVAAYADTDPVMLARILRNLVTNACRHSGARRITLEARADGAGVAVCVCDDGRGIPEAEQQRVFSEFFQLGNPERDRTKGLGLGLAIVRRLADLLRHGLRLESRPGEGCRFCLSLPRSRAPRPTPEPDAGPEDSGADELAGLFVILVDDEAAVRDAMRILLKQWGCELLVADGVESLRRSLRALDYPRPDIVLADYRLRGGTTGLDVLDAVEAHFGAAVPAVIISGDTDAAVRRHAQRRGAPLLHKPVDAQTLHATLARVAAS